MNVNENLSLVSSALDLKSFVRDATVCGASSSLIQVTVVPALTVMRFGAKAKLSICTPVSVACGETPGAAAAAATMAAASAAATQIWRVIAAVMTQNSRISPAAACQ